jgi:glycosyltransferase involved in cell wall biosynthesis
VLSRFAAEEFERAIGIEARVIHPGVNLDAFAPGVERSADPTIFCAAAIDSPAKRVDLLVEAFGIVRQRVPEARLLLSRPADRGAAARFDVSGEGIELVDVDDRDDLARTYGTSWVSVLPSTGEPFGLVLVESLAAGTPVVGSADGAVPEIVDSERIGRLFDGEAKELAAALLEALELASDSATPAACRRRAEDFSLDRCVSAYEALYRELPGS